MIIPSEGDRKDITDADRVFPGDGAAPLDTLLRSLRDIGFRGMLSLGVFNREYWKQDGRCWLPAPDSKRLAKRCKRPWLSTRLWTMVVRAARFAALASTAFNRTCL